jgi:serine/threonine protein kinase
VDGKKMPMTRACGTANWSAPEIFESHRYDDRVDIFSYGGLLFELLLHRLPFEGMPPMKFSVEICHGKRPPLPVGKERKICDLIRQCWKHNPKKRPAFRDIYERIVAGKAAWDGTQPQSLKALKKLVAKAQGDSSPKIRKKK